MYIIFSVLTGPSFAFCFKNALIIAVRICIASIISSCFFAVRRKSTMYYMYDYSL